MARGPTNVQDADMTKTRQRPARGTGPPVVVLVGQPNVGKSTLFNQLCGSRAALVANHPGLTRDRHYGHARLAERSVTLIDTGGLGAVAGDMQQSVAAQVDAALAEADIAVLVADARVGAMIADQEIAQRLRRSNIDVVVAANKIDGAPPASTHEFAALGFGDAIPVSAAHGRGIRALASAVAARLPQDEEECAPRPSGIRVAVAGRPNVGKSTLVNRLLGEQRQVVDAQPGTTRDAIDIPYRGYTLIDTAGVRRKGAVANAKKAQRTVETFSIVKTLDALDRAEVALLVVDGTEGIVDQDLHILSYALEAGAGVVLVVNKWDGLGTAEQQRTRASVARRLAFAPWLPVRYASALRNIGVRSLLAHVDAVHRAGAFAVTTAELNRILAAATRDHPPPTVRARTIKLRYAHKAGAHPPTIIVHGNQTESLPASYLRYLANRFRTELDLTGVPVNIETRTTRNPYSERRNTPTARQIKRRKRLIRHRQGR